MELTAASGLIGVWVVVALSTLFDFVASIPIDNGVIGLPQVECQENKVAMIFNTQKPFTGRIFVKGMVGEEGCSQSFASNGGTSALFEVGAGGCNMRRTRRIDGTSRGVEQSMTVIISFHSVFITKIDRAYRCTCFFMEADKIVTNRFDVSMLATTDLIDTARMPLCTYSVRRGSITGPVVSYATVGEEVYHVWDCDSDMFGMLVHGCFVDDGSGGKKFELLDEKGCSIDPTIMTDLTYNQQLNMAYVESHVSKFPDRSSTYFQCAVSICMKADGACRGVTPPVCRSRGAGPGPTPTGFRQFDQRSRLRGGPGRGKRSLNDAEDDVTSRLMADFDLNAEPILVLDIDDGAATRRHETGQEHSSASRSRVTGGGGGRWLGSRFAVDAAVADASSSRVCLSAAGFGLLLAIVTLVLTACITVIALFYVRQRSGADAAQLKR